MTKVSIDNTPTSAIGAEAVSVDSVNIKEVGLYQQLLQLAIFPQAQATLAEKIQTACGLSLPAFGQKSENDKLKILATQPDKWLFIADKQPEWLLQLIDNEWVFANEQSSAYSVIEITGDNAGRFVQQLSFIDLKQAIPVLLTQLADDYNGIVEKIAEQENKAGYRLYITRTMAKSFWDILMR